MEPLLTTKLYIPPPRPGVVPRQRLIDRLNDGLHRKLILISAPAGFGKTTLISEWLARSGCRIAWLSLDEADSDPPRFLTYLIAALQGIAPQLGEGILAMLHAPMQSPIDPLLTTLLNEINTIPDEFVLALDDYHVLDSPVIDHALTVLLKHLPPQMHLVITTREDPPLPLARLRVRDQLTELRAADLRFTPDEATDFLNQAMGLSLSPEDIATLEARTEGWIAGLQLAALSMQGRADPAAVIQSFTGSHHFVLDYLLEEVLHQQPEAIQSFLLHTAILDRLCGPLCDALLHDQAIDGQRMLAAIQQANLFLIPLDDERRWYRYHRLFADLLRKRLHQDTDLAGRVPELHSRASAWYEANGFELEAFQHAVAANDIERTQRLIEGGGLPFLFRGIVHPVLNWLESLPVTTLDARPALWVWSAQASTFAGRGRDVEPKLQAAENALNTANPNAEERDLIGHIAAIRAMLAIPGNDKATILTQSQRALDYLHPDNLPARASATWALGYAYQVGGNRAEAIQAYTETVAMSRASGDFMNTIAVTTTLGQVQETENHLRLAAESYRQVIAMAGDPPLPYACEAYLGLARIHYEWHDLESARQLAEQGLQLAEQLENVDTPVAGLLLLARLELARGATGDAAATLTRAEQFVRTRQFTRHMPRVAAAQVRVYLRQGSLTAAGRLVQEYDLPLSQARLHLAEGNPSTALAVLQSARQAIEQHSWADARLEALILEAAARHLCGAEDDALNTLHEALLLAQPDGFIRSFVDEGAPVAALLDRLLSRGIEPDYVRRLLAVFPEAERTAAPPASGFNAQLLEPLSDRELEILQLIAQGLTNRDIAARLYLSLHTVKVHAHNIYGKLDVRNRTQAVAKGRALNILPDA